MKVTPASIPEVLLIEPRIFGDCRGLFFESYQQQRYAAAGLPAGFVQDNISRSGRGTVRGLHLQHPFGQGKLVQAIAGEVFDVAVDVRVGSPTFGRWVGFTLSEDNHHQLYVPVGFAHGFCVRSEMAIFAYKCTELYHPETELGIAYDDPELAIPWDIGEPALSDKDSALPRLAELDRELLPTYRSEEGTA